VTTDIDTLIGRSARLETADLDLGCFAGRRLDPATLRCLRYMHDVEGHTACYLRDVLATRAHRDPEMTAFLACWCYEEHWHGDAIASVLRAHGEVAGADRLARARHSLPKRDALRPVVFTVASALSRHVVAVHMAWGALNEWTTQAGYARLAAKAKHPVLTELLRRIMRQEGRHIDFYALQARRRLAESPTARRLTHAALRRYWAPVGSGLMPRAELDFLVTHLFADDEGRQAAARIDRLVGRLPGLGGLHLVEQAAVTHLDASLATHVAPRRPTTRHHSGGRNITTRTEQQKGHRHAC